MDGLEDRQTFYLSSLLLLKALTVVCLLYLSDRTGKGEPSHSSLDVTWLNIYDLSMSSTE